MKARRAIFIDRDGTLIEERHYLHRPEEVEFYPGAIEALGKAAAAGFAIVMVTNQSGVGRGYFQMSDVERVHEHLRERLAARQVSLVAIYVAPEAPEAPSRGRKPSPQFLYDARDEHGIDLARSYMVGDKLIDLECGWNAGVRKSILVRTGHGAKIEAVPGRAVVAEDLGGAIEWILGDAAEENGGLTQVKEEKKSD